LLQQPEVSPFRALHAREHEWRALAGAKVVAERLAGRRRGAEGAQKVVRQLERDARGRREALESSQHRGLGATEQRSHPERAAHRVAPGLQRVPELGIVAAPRNVEHLTGDHVDLHARVALEHRTHAVARDRHGGEHLRRQARREVARQHADGRTTMRVTETSSELRMHRRTPTPERVAVHPVVVDQQVRVQQLEHEPGPQRDVGRPTGARDAVAEVEQRRTDALPPPEPEPHERGEHRRHLRALRRDRAELLLEEGLQSLVHVALDAR
jgi:hypothetical protein